MHNSLSSSCTWLNWMHCTSIFTHPVSQESNWSSFGRWEWNVNGTSLPRNFLSTQAQHQRHRNYFRIIFIFCRLLFSGRLLFHCLSLRSFFCHQQVTSGRVERRSDAVWTTIDVIYRVNSIKKRLRGTRKKEEFSSSRCGDWAVIQCS